MSNSQCAIAGVFVAVIIVAGVVDVVAVTKAGDCLFGVRACMVVSDTIGAGARSCSQSESNMAPLGSYDSSGQVSLKETPSGHSYTNSPKTILVLLVPITLKS